MEVCCVFVDSISKKHSSQRNTVCLSAYLLCECMTLCLCSLRTYIYLQRNSQIEIVLCIHKRHYFEWEEIGEDTMKSVFPWDRSHVSCSTMKNNVSKYNTSHMATFFFIGIVLTQLNSPSEKRMRRNGLAEEASGCIHIAAVIVWIQCCWVSSLGPLQWMGNDLSVSTRHSTTALQTPSSDTSCCDPLALCAQSLKSPEDDPLHSCIVSWPVVSDPWGFQGTQHERIRGSLRSHLLAKLAICVADRRKLSRKVVPGIVPVKWFSNFGTAYNTRVLGGKTPSAWGKVWPNVWK